MFSKIIEFIELHKKLVISELAIYILAVAVFFAPVALASVISVENVIKLVNDARAALNIDVLRENAALKKAAEEKAQDMIEKNYFAHISPEGRTPWQWIEENNYDYRYAGENLAINFSAAEDEQKAWMESPLHKKNILNPDYDEIGVAVKRGVVEGQKTTVVVQMFGKQQSPVSLPGEYSGKRVEGVEAASGADDFSESRKNLSTLFAENRVSATGWLFAFGLAIFFIIIDIAAIMHKRHKPFFITQRI